MGQVRRSAESELDYLEIWLYVAKDDPVAADQLLRAFDEKLNLLSDSPLVGRAREELAHNLRSSPVGNYILFYRPADGGVELVRLLHGARDIRRLFRRS